MKSLATIRKNIESNKELMKEINKNEYQNIDNFIEHSKRYIKAIKENRMICVIGSVSTSGMSRTIKFASAEKDKRGHFYAQYWVLFTMLGYKQARNNRDYFTISGYGMDMIFHTNYTIIHRLGKLGFLSDAEVRTLVQKTPGVL